MRPSVCRGSHWSLPGPWGLSVGTSSTDVIPCVVGLRIFPAFFVAAFKAETGMLSEAEGVGFIMGLGLGYFRGPLLHFVQEVAHTGLLFVSLGLRLAAHLSLLPLVLVGLALLPIGLTLLIAVVGRMGDRK